jgi:hypothetical protein
LRRGTDKAHPVTLLSYPAARTESLLELKGARAWIVVPRLGCDSIGRQADHFRVRCCSGETSKVSEIPKNCVVYGRASK